MDALILSCGTGGGHDSAARAVLEEMKNRGHNAVMLNPYTLKSRRLAKGIDNSYISLARRTPALFGLIYKLGNAYRRLPFRSPIYFLNRGAADVLEEYLRKNSFDVIITTHFFAGDILANLKEQGIRVPPTVFVATDYVCTPFTEETVCDAYVIPACDLKTDFINRGIPEEKLYPLGIPTARDFSSHGTKAEAKARLGLSQEKKYIAVSGGSMGGGSIQGAIDRLCSYFSQREDTELIIICGSNKALFDRLTASSRGGVTVVGHTDRMADYLGAAELFVTKPGGLSSTEAAVCGVPIWHTGAIPGCESYNARYFSSRGLSISGRVDGKRLREADELINSEERRSLMLSRQKEYINPHAAEQICRLAEAIERGNSKNEHEVYSV